MTSPEAECNTGLRKSTRLAAANRAHSATPSLDGATRGRSSRRRDVPRTAVTARNTPSSAKALKQKYRWLSEMDDDANSVDSDTDSHCGASMSVISASEDENDSDVTHRTVPKLPEYEDDQPREELKLPPSCDDLLVSNEHVLQVAGVYEILRHFSQPLRLSPFRFEDFCAALSQTENSRLLDEVHIALLRTVVRADEGLGTMFSSADCKDSVSIMMFCGISDPVAWFELCRLYLKCLPPSNGLQTVLKIFDCRFSYDVINMTERLIILQVLVDLFLATELAREFLVSSNLELEHESHCRSCNRLYNFSVQLLLYICCGLG
jgi:nucleosome-remodeling factor subunit BPTF